MTRIEELEKYIESLRVAHGREMQEERERTKAAEFDATVARWAVQGLLARNLRLMLPDFAQIKGNQILDVAEHLGKRCAHDFLHGAELAFRAHAEFARAKHHIMYLENHGRANGLHFRPFEEYMRDEKQPIPQRRDWPTAEPLGKSAADRTNDL